MPRAFLLLGCCLLTSSLSFGQAGPPPSLKGKSGADGFRQGLWSDLASPDAVKAYRAGWTLRRTPAETVAFLAAQLPPAVKPDPQQVQQWINDLGSERFAVRQNANRELEKLGGLAERALTKAIQRSLPLEADRRVKKLLDKLQGPLTLPEHLRLVRVVEILEGLGTADARRVLRIYASGAEGSRLTQDARDALERLDKRHHLPVVALPQKRPPTDQYGDSLPAGAVARLGTIRFRHGGGDAFFLPGDKTLLTVSRRGNVVQIWDVASGRFLRELSTKPLSIQRLVLVPGGKQFVVAGTFPWIARNQPGPVEVRVIDVASGKVVQTLPRDEFRDVNDCQLALSADGKLLFSLGSSGMFRVEEIATGKEVLRRKFTSDSPGGIAASPGGKHLAIASGPNSRKLYLWKWRDQEPRELKGFEYGLRGVAFSPDGKLLAAVGEHGGTVRAWTVPVGRLLYQRDFPDKDYYFFGQPAFTPDGKTLAVPANHRRGRGSEKIELLEPATGRSQAILEGGGRLAFSSDSRRVACSAGSALRLYDLAAQKVVNRNDEAHEGDPTYLIVSPRGFLVSASEDNTVRIWDAASNRQRQKFAVDAWIRAIGLSPDGNLLAASSFDDAVHVWDTNTSREVYRLAGHGEMGGRRTLSFDPSGQCLLSSGDDFYLRRWDMKTGKAQLEHAIRPDGVKTPDEDDVDSDRGNRKNLGMMMGSAVFTPDGKTFVLDNAGNFHLFDTASGKEKAKFPSQQSIHTEMTISASGRYLLASPSGDQHSISLWDLRTGKRLWNTLVAGFYAGPVVFSADDRMFATSVDEPNHQILIFEMASGQLRHAIRGFRGRVRSLAFFPDGRRLASGLTDSSILIWDLSAAEGTNKGS
jgi:WD40 repeat protein